MNSDQKYIYIVSVFLILTAGWVAMAYALIDAVGCISGPLCSRPFAFVIYTLGGASIATLLLYLTNKTIGTKSLGEIALILFLFILSNLPMFYTLANLFYPEMISLGI